MKGMCLIVQSVAPSTDSPGLPGRLSSHVATCLSCQAEMARYRKLRRQLAALAAVTEPAPRPLAAAVADAVTTDTAKRGKPAHGQGRARLAAAAGAVAAATAGVVVAVRRQSKAAT